MVLGLRMDEARSRPEAAKVGGWMVVVCRVGCHLCSALSLSVLCLSIVMVRGHC